MLTLRANHTLTTDRLNLSLHAVPTANIEVKRQYVYLLLLGSLVADGGRGIDLFYATGACWLVDDSPA